jgi:spore coat protein H
MLFRALLLALCVTALVSAASDAPKVDKRARNDGLFTNGTMHSIQIEMPLENVAALKKDARTFVSCTFKEGGITYTNVAIRLKGVGSFRPIDEKPSFALKFNKFVAKQEFYGLSRVGLNNSVQDPTYINEALCGQFFRDIGVPAARATHAWVQLNGRELGLYVLMEGINKDFLRRNFKTDTGNLYEAYTQDIDTDLDQDNGEDISQSDLRTLAKAAREPNASERWERLNKMMDVDRFISILAGEVLTVHWDGYGINKNNYQIYHNPVTDKLVMFPHGMDNMFQVPTWSWRPSMPGLLARAVLLTPQGQTRYQERISIIATNEGRAQVLTNRLNEIAALLRPAIAERKAADLKDWERQVAGLRERIVARLQNLSEQLAGLKQPTKFDAKGVAKLDGWKSQADVGRPECTRAGDILKIKQAGGGAGMASWRARAVLDPGKYRFEGKVRTVEILPVNGADTGATLRISGAKIIPQLRGPSDWRPVSFTFEVPFASDQVELVCEFGCLVGEAWFDAGSMRLVRVQ